jgi:histidinol-phosphate aminotransferase
MSVWKYANEWLKDLESYEPGKPIDEVARELGLEPGEVVKLASNENPLGPSPKAVMAMQEAVTQAHVYPDGGGYRLRTAIAEKCGLELKNVILGNGSNEIIEFIGHGFLRPGDEVVVADHAFVVYKLMATLFGATTVEVPDPGFVHDLDAMAEAITPRTKEIFIANPNNPTGTLVNQEAIDRFMDRVPEHVVVVFDEAYYEFLDEAPDTLKYVREGRNVIVLRTFSKIQGLAALRIGYGLGSEELVGVLQKTRQPFNANAIAQAGALAGLADTEHQERTKAVTDEGRAFLERAFGEMGLEYVPSTANFVLVKVGDGDGLFQRMLKKGVIIRAMRGYKLPEWIRVTVGTPAQNERFLAVLKEELGGDVG